MNSDVVQRRGAGLSTEHHDSDVYWLSVLESVRSPDGQSTEAFCGQLNRLASSTVAAGRIRFAAELLDIVRRFETFREVDRVCLAGVIPNSNELIAVDSACSGKIRENLMVPGYSCYVDPKGSLFQMRPGMLRIFGDSAHVIASFRREGRPVQRSIGKTAGMGLRSGFCLAIGSEVRTWGFLFMNSCVPNYFEGIEETHATHLSALSVYAKPFLQSRHFGESQYCEAEKLERARGEAFSPKVLLELLKEAHGKFLPGEPKLRIKMDNVPRFLCNHERLTKILTQIAIEIRLAQRRTDSELCFHFGRSEAGIVVRVEHDFRAVDACTTNLFQQRLKEICDSEDSVGFRVETDLDQTEIAFNYEHLNPRCGERLYSTDEEAT